MYFCYDSSILTSLAEYIQNLSGIEMFTVNMAKFLLHEVDQRIPKLKQQIIQFEAQGTPAPTATSRGSTKQCCSSPQNLVFYETYNWVSHNWVSQD